MLAFSELSNMTDEPIDSTKTCSEDSTVEVTMWHILSFKILQKNIYFGVTFLGLLYFLPTELTRIWISPPGYDFFSIKDRCCNSYPINLEF